MLGSCPPPVTSPIAGVFVLLGLVSLPGIDRISPDDRPVDARRGPAGARRHRGPGASGGCWPVAVLLVVRGDGVGVPAARLPPRPGHLRGGAGRAHGRATLPSRRCRPLPSLGAYGGLLLAPAHDTPAPSAARPACSPATAWVAIPFTVGVAGRAVAARARTGAQRLRPAPGRRRAAAGVPGGTRRGRARSRRDPDAGRHRPVRRRRSRPGRRWRRSGGPAGTRSTSCA